MEKKRKSWNREEAKERLEKKEAAEAERLENLLFGTLNQDHFHNDPLDDQETSVITTTAAASAVDDADAERNPVWEDEEESEARVSIQHVSRLRKLMKDGDPDFIPGSDYVSRLRAQYTKLNPGTSWALLPSEKQKQKQKQKQQKLSSGVSDSEDDDSDVVEEEQLQILRSGEDAFVKNKSRLPQGFVEISKMTDANVDERSNAVVQSVEFHQNAQILLTAGFDRKVRFFQIDGKKNPKVQSVFLEDYAIRKASFVPGGGAQVIISARRNFFFSYDMQAGSVERSCKLIGREEKSLESFEVSPDGKLIAFLGNEGYILLVSTKTKQLIGTLKMNGSARAVAFAGGGSLLLSTGGDGEVYHWDLRTRKCIHKGKDEGCVKSTVLCTSPDSKLFATASDSGVVNLYNRESYFEGNSTPIKAFMNLTTTVDTMKFNRDSQILAICSRMKKNALRLVHVPSRTVFSNWPTENVPLQLVHSLDFSPGGGFLAVGNAGGRVLLFRLRHYEHA